jgi:hypothetical protein
MKYYSPWNCDNNIATTKRLGTKLVRDCYDNTKRGVPSSRGEERKSRAEPLRKARVNFIRLIYG